ncbi:thioredoxin-disulfide reductase [Aquibaculum sediminis]|uniref:thioredoxin-disulfide reductase n=1 Tax=Aquibaculum sediminis TaxID=3231907 RepID=UPI00345586EE
MSDTRHSRVLILGSGPAGYTAAIYAARANLKPMLIQGLEPGGQLSITTDVENYPGFADPIQGPWLMEQMGAQAANVGTEIISDTIVEVNLKQRPFLAVGDSGTRYTGDSFIICTGAQARWLGVPGEERLRGFGVSACATCDGFFYRGKQVAVIGGGNTAAEEALFLTNFAEKVHLVHRRDSMRAEKILQDRLFANSKIEFIWNSVVEEVLGDEGQGGLPPGVTGVRLKSSEDGGQRDLAVDGVFVAIGHDPATQLFKEQLRTDPNGYILTAPDSTATDIPGVYAAGDVKDHVYRQAVTAAGMGCMAALEAERWLAIQDLAEQAAE